MQAEPWRRPETVDLIAQFQNPKSRHDGMEWGPYTLALPIREALDHIASGTLLTLHLVTGGGLWRIRSRTCAAAYLDIDTTRKRWVYEWAPDLDQIKPAALRTPEFYG